MGLLPLHAVDTDTPHCRSKIIVNLRHIQIISIIWLQDENEVQVIWCCESLRSPQFFWQKLQCVAILPARVSMQAPQCGRVLDLCTAGFAKTVSNRIKPLKIVQLSDVQCFSHPSPSLLWWFVRDRQDISDLPHPPTTNHHPQDLTALSAISTSARSFSGTNCKANPQCSTASQVDAANVQLWKYGKLKQGAPCGWHQVDLLKTKFGNQT